MTSIPMQMPIGAVISFAVRVDRSRIVLWDLSGHAGGQAGSDRSIASGRLRNGQWRRHYGENLKQAMDTLRTHKLRSGLTVFGVVLGVSVIMLVPALITGFDQNPGKHQAIRRGYRVYLQVGPGIPRRIRHWKNGIASR